MSFRNERFAAMLDASPGPGASDPTPEQISEAVSRVREARSKGGRRGPVGRRTPVSAADPGPRRRPPKRRAEA